MKHVMNMIYFLHGYSYVSLHRLGMSGDKDFSGVATNLLTEILRLSSDLLPRSVCAKLNVSYSY